MATIEVKLVCVQIQRNHEVINSTVPEHEVRILKAMHGPDNVKVVAELDPEVEAKSLDDGPANELLRLHRLYTHKGQDRSPVDVAYPGGELDLERYGFIGSMETTEQVRSETKVRKPAKKAAKPSK